MKDVLYNLAFAGFAVLTAVSAVAVAGFSNLLHAAVALFFSLTGVAGLYFLLGADFLGVAQLLVYAGGILVLIIFGVFLTARIYEGTKLEVSTRRVPVALGLLIAAAVFSVLATVLVKVDFPLADRTFQPTVKRLGTLLLTQYLLPFELVSVLLLFALVGAAVLVRKEIGEEK